MTLYIAGFIIALVLSLLVIAWIAYCMFVKEKHKSEFYQRNISDLQRRNHILSQVEGTIPEKKEIGVGVLVLPSRYKDKDDKFERRPDYPESPIPISMPSCDKLIEILDDGDTATHYRDGICEVDSSYAKDSEV